MVALGIFGSTILIQLSLSGGRVNGEGIYQVHPLWRRDDLRKDLL
jgi:hypothetical protein